MKNICIFASGAGTNAEHIIKHFDDHDNINIALIVTNNETAGVLRVADKHNIEAITIDKEYFYGSEALLKELKENDINFIVLAGFMWLVPAYLIKAYPNKIVNIHPALLPKYGGKGMYGMHVHKAVIANKEKESGISIHFVNEHYDEGNIILQAKCVVDPADTPETLAHKIHELEYENYAKVIENLPSAIDQK